MSGTLQHLHRAAQCFQPSKAWPPCHCHFRIYSLHIRNGACDTDPQESAWTEGKRSGEKEREDAGTYQVQKGRWVWISVHGFRGGDLERWQLASRPLTSSDGKRQQRKRGRLLEEGMQCWGACEQV